jgi:anti-sigma regulatory factor (Ser/Thr protein kinase)
MHSLDMEVAGKRGVGLDIQLEPSAQAAEEAREAVRDGFADSLPAFALHELGTVIFELVDNGVRHGPGSPIRVSVGERDGVIHGEVDDDGDGSSSIPRLVVDPFSGLGFHIVDALVDRWEVRDGTTVVSFEMGVDRVL